MLPDEKAVTGITKKKKPEMVLLIFHEDASHEHIHGRLAPLAPLGTWAQYLDNPTRWTLPELTCTGELQTQ